MNKKEAISRKYKDRRDNTKLGRNLQKKVCYLKAFYKSIIIGLISIFAKSMVLSLITFIIMVHSVYNVTRSSKRGLKD